MLESKLPEIRKILEKIESKINENDLDIVSSPFIQPNKQQASPAQQAAIKSESTEPLVSAQNATAVDSAALNATAVKPQFKRFKSCLSTTATTATSNKANSLKQKHKSFSAFSNLNRNKIIKFNSQDQPPFHKTLNSNEKELRNVLSSLKANETTIQQSLFNSSSNHFKKMKSHLLLKK